MVAAATDAGFNAPIYLAGGAARDIILGKSPNDLDVMIEKENGAEEFGKIYLNYCEKNNIKVSTPGKAVGANFGVYKFRHDGLELDFATSRTDTYTEDSRKPTVESASLNEDAERRDFSINAMYVCIYGTPSVQPDDKVDIGGREFGVYDPTHKGIKDLKNGVISFVNDDHDFTLSEDPIRALRAVKFSGRKFGEKTFTIEPETSKSIKDFLNSEKGKELYLKKVKPERPWKELKDILTAQNLKEAMKQFKETGVRDFIFDLPKEEFNSWDMDQLNKHHNLNLYDHTIFAMENLGEGLHTMGENGLPISKDTEATIQLAMLLHDVGKRHKEFKPREDGTVKYLKHENKSTDVLKKYVWPKLAQLPPKTQEIVNYFVKSHMDFHKYPKKDEGDIRFLKQMIYNLLPKTFGGSLGADKEKQMEIMSYVVSFFGSADSSAKQLEDEEKNKLTKDYEDFGNRLRLSKPRNLLFNVAAPIIKEILTNHGVQIYNSAIGSIYEYLNVYIINVSEEPKDIIQFVSKQTEQILTNVKNFVKEFINEHEGTNEQEALDKYLANAHKFSGSIKHRFKKDAIFEVLSDLYKDKKINGDVKMPKLVIAKYKSKKKLDTGTVVYEYGEADKKKRAKKKARQVRKVFQNINKIKKSFEKDLKSDDKKIQMTALAVGIIYHIYERVGDRANVGTGVTSFRKKHITVKGNKVQFKYVGKSHMKQDKTLTDSTIAKIIKENLEGKSSNAYLFDYTDENGKKFDVYSSDINEYLKSFNITAKDLRAHAANDILIAKLKSAGKAKGESPEEKEKWRKEKLKELIEETADEIGHTPGICKSSYIDPSLMDEYIASGKIIKLAADFDLTVIIKLADISVNPKIKELMDREFTPEEQSIISNPHDVRSTINDEVFLQALSKAKQQGTLSGLLEIVEDNDPSAFGVTPVIVGGKAIPIIGLNVNKIKEEAAQKGKSIEEVLSEQVKQFLGVMAHEKEHVEGKGEPEAERVQKDEVSKQTSQEGSSSKLTMGSLKLASTDKSLFQKLGIRDISNDTLLKVSNNVLKILGIPNTNLNIGLLSLGYLVMLGNHPYRSEWNIRQATGLSEPINIKEAQTLYNILDNAIDEKPIEEDKAKEYYSFSDEDKMNLGELQSLKWESEPSYAAGTGMGFYPQTHPFNY